MCLFANVPPDKVVDLVNASMGVSLTLENLIEDGERAWNLKHVINHRLGLRQKDDRLPKNLLIPYDDDPDGTAGFVPDFINMLMAYYDARGWDRQTGFPTGEKLESLDLGWTAKDLESVKLSIGSNT
jgi:aldehyde:ferredoxin oxidoreductase